MRVCVYACVCVCLCVSVCVPLVRLQFEAWKVSESEAIKREKQKASRLTKTLEQNAALEKRYVQLHCHPPCPQLMIGQRYCQLCAVEQGQNGA